MATNHDRIHLPLKLVNERIEARDDIEVRFTSRVAIAELVLLSHLKLP